MINELLTASKQWYITRKLFLEKDGKTVAGDLLDLSNAEDELNKIVKKLLKDGWDVI
jgi:hypothetical protein